MKDSIITLHDFGVAYEKKTVLEGINTSIQRGRITAIIVPGGRRGFHCGQFLRGEKEVIVIPWEMICKIGDDVILVDVEVG
jgi:sporulation protein YlmC with PRC-barrel domain